ncbi:uncharacterized protein ACR2FA_006768 [Aphomia sociella]
MVSKGVIMLIYALTSVVYLTTSVTCRDVKSVKPAPTITNSLVNLGKMDISFHFNTKEAVKQKSLLRPSSSFFFSNGGLPSASLAEEPCPCSTFRDFKDSMLGHPSEIINKILLSNDLFSFNKDAITSTLCCDSHEHTQEDVVTFEFGPKQLQINKRLNPLNFSPVIYDNITPRKPAPSLPLKQKAVEIFLFPKKTDVPFDFGKLSTKSDLVKKDKKMNTIQIVGDKELKNNFKNWKLRPTSSTLKNDLTFETKTIKPEDKEDSFILKNKTTANNENSVISSI